MASRVSARRLPRAWNWWRQPGAYCVGGRVRADYGVNLRRVLAMRIHLTGVALAGALARAAIAQSPAQPPAPIPPVGVWRGTSACLVRPSGCNDEIVVFRITQIKAADSVAV